MKTKEFIVLGIMLALLIGGIACLSLSATWRMDDHFNYTIPN